MQVPKNTLELTNNQQFAIYTYECWIDESSIPEFLNDDDLLLQILLLEQLYQQLQTLLYQTNFKYVTILHNVYILIVCERQRRMEKSYVSATSYNIVFIFLHAIWDFCKH